MQQKEEISLQEWLPLDSILEKGIIKLKSGEFVKIINIVPINYNLKSDLEKERNIKFVQNTFKNLQFWHSNNNSKQ